MSIDAGPWVDQGATFTECGRWRYRLWRAWDESLPRCVFVMLNPSVANAVSLDPTVRRCVTFAKKWGCGSLDVVNIFAWVDGDPKGLLSSPDPVGPDNDRHIIQAARGAKFVISAWSGWASLHGRGAHVELLLRRHGIPLWCLGKTGDGHPRHPLYMKGDAVPVPF